MGVFNRKGTVRDGLVLELDAANQKSWGADQTKWKDTTSQGNDGTLTNGPVHSQGPFPGAGYVNIDGTSRTQGLTLPSVSTVMGNGTGDWTIEFWYMTPSFTTSGGTTTAIPLINNIYWYDGNNGSFWSTVDSGRTISIATQHSGGAFGTDVLVTSTSTISTGVWYHIAFVKQGNTLRLYFNGVQEDTDTVTNLSSSGFNSSGNALSIGRWYNYISSAPDTSEFGIGNFSNVRIVNSAVYPDGTSFTPQVSELTAVSNTKLLTCQKGTITDTSVSGHSITVNGNAAAVYNDVSYFDFDGSDDTVGTTNSNFFGEASSTPTVSMEIWAKITRKSGGGNQYQQLAGSRNNSNFDFYFLLLDTSGATVNTEARLRTSGGNYDISVSYNAYFDKWTHIVFTANVNRTDLYFNGVLVGSNTSVTGSFGSSTGNFAVGTEYGGSWPVLGNMGTVRIYNKALTSTEVAQNFNALRARFGI